VRGERWYKYGDLVLQFRILLIKLFLHPHIITSLSLGRQDIMMFTKSQYVSALVALLPLCATALPATPAKHLVARASGNPFSGYQFCPVPQYSDEIKTNAIPNLTSDLKAAASEVADSIGTFFWMDTADKVPVMGKYLANIQALNDAGASPPYMGQFVVYDLPDRDCAALASNGEYSIAKNCLANYKAYVDAIAKQVQAYPDVNIAFVVEPDSLANMVTNLNVQKCANAADTYKTGVAYALKNLDFDNVSMYMDAGHAGWLGWAANIQPAAQLFAQIYKDAGSPAAVCGLATNVANYNAWSVTTCAAYTQGDNNCDEKRYVNALGPLLEAEGFPAHFITDTGRNGVQPTSQ